MAGQTDPKRETFTTVASEQRRSERVHLQIRLQLTARLPQGQRICIEGKTLVVNAHGGLLELGMELEPGQRILLSNFRSLDLVTATVLRAESGVGDRFLAAFEFEFPMHDFWPVTFPPDDLSWMD